MEEKIFSRVVAVSLSFAMGCYSTGSITKGELKANAGQVDITLFTKGSLEYKFLKDNYHIRGDTLTGFGVRRSNTSSEIVLDASFAIADFDSIEAKEFDATTTILVCGGVGVGASLIMYILLHTNEPDHAVQPSGAGHP